MQALIERDLNDEQRAAILANGSSFLVACPGSGKTRTLTYKVALELTRLKSEREYVIAITYTNRAADEIHERIEQLGIDTSRLWIGTIHAFCLEWILKPYAIYLPAISHGFRVIDSHDKEKLFAELAKPYRGCNLRPNDFEFHFTSSGYVLSCTQPNKQAALHEILKIYFQTLAVNRQIDFELILYYAHQLITSQQSIAVLLSRMFSFILVDEYQDTKEIQYAIIAAILKASRGKTKTFVVGDPNQAIYGSLGGFAISAADFKAMADINLNEIPLSKNYRSSERIVGYFSNYHVHPAQVVAESADRKYPSFITYNRSITRCQLEDELIRIIDFAIKKLGICPNEICVLAPQWTHLASMTRALVTRLPQYQFNGPGLVPFSRDVENFWFKVSKIVLTEPSPYMYVKRLRWAREVISLLEDSGVSVAGLTPRYLLRESNSIAISETDGLTYLREFFRALFTRVGVNIRNVPLLHEHYEAFFESSQVKIDRLRREGVESIADIAAFKKVFAPKSGITVSSIHGVKGGEYDVVIAYALLEGMVPHFSDPNKQESAKKLLYVISSRARKNLHLISETGRQDIIGNLYNPTKELTGCTFSYDASPWSGEI